MLDVARAQAPLHDEMMAALDAVCRSGQFVLGPECSRLEKSIAQTCETKHAIGCASGSDALLLALMALDVGRGDEVIVPSFTFFATASAVTRLGARPVFVDIDPVSFNLDPAAVAAAITRFTKAIIPVHLFGQSANMAAILQETAGRGIHVVEDVCQAIGASFDGRAAGSIGEIGCLSFYPTKNLGGCGDGGMLTTNDDNLAERLRLLRGHGMAPRYYHQVVGINSRLDSLQAAALNVKLPHLARWTQQRRENARRYTELLTATQLDSEVILPAVSPHCGHVWNQYTVRVEGGKRDALRQQMAQEGIGSEIYYPVPLHRQQCFEFLKYGQGSLPHTERAAMQVLSLPNFPGLTLAEQERVVDSIARFFRQSLSRPARQAA